VGSVSGFHPTSGYIQYSTAGINATSGALCFDVAPLTDVGIASSASFFKEEFDAGNGFTVGFDAPSRKVFYSKASSSVSSRLDSGGLDWSSGSWHSVVAVWHYREDFPFMIFAVDGGGWMKPSDSRGVGALDSFMYVGNYGPTQPAYDFVVNHLRICRPVPTTTTTLAAGYHTGLSESAASPSEITSGDMVFDTVYDTQSRLSEGESVYVVNGTDCSATDNTECSCSIQNVGEPFFRACSCSFVAPASEGLYEYVGCSIGLGATPVEYLIVKSGVPEDRIQLTLVFNVSTNTPVVNCSPQVWFNATTGWVDAELFGDRKSVV
jgi:hypothetical protein